jgi:hypothetical protein
MTGSPEPPLREQDPSLLGEFGIWIGEVIRDILSLSKKYIHPETHYNKKFEYPSFTDTLLYCSES